LDWSCLSVGDVMCDDWLFKFVNNIVRLWLDHLYSLDLIRSLLNVFNMLNWDWWLLKIFNVFYWNWWLFKILYVLNWNWCLCEVLEM